MKQYRIDGLSPQDREKLADYLTERLGPPMLETIYWMELDPEVLTPLQKSHEECRPHCFTLELGSAFLSCEFLVRIKNSIKCDCMAYADARQREWLITTVDHMLDTLDITA